MLALTHPMDTLSWENTAKQRSCKKKNKVSAYRIQRHGTGWKRLGGHLFPEVSGEPSNRTLSFHRPHVPLFLMSLDYFSITEGTQLWICNRPPSSPSPRPSRASASPFLSAFCAKVSSPLSFKVGLNCSLWALLLLPQHLSSWVQATSIKLPVAVVFGAASGK